VQPSDLLPRSGIKQALGPGTETKSCLFPMGWPCKCAAPCICRGAKGKPSAWRLHLCSCLRTEAARTGGLLKNTLELCGEGCLLPPGCKSLQAERTGRGPATGPVSGTHFSPCHTASSTSQMPAQSHSSAGPSNTQLQLSLAFSRHSV